MYTVERNSNKLCINFPYKHTHKRNTSQHLTLHVLGQHIDTLHWKCIFYINSTLKITCGHHVFVVICLYSHHSNCKSNTIEYSRSVFNRCSLLIYIKMGILLICSLMHDVQCTFINMKKVV